MKLGIFAHVVIMTCAAYFIRLSYLLLVWGPALAVGYLIANSVATQVPLAGQLYIGYTMVILTHLCIKSIIKMTLARRAAQKKQQKNAIKHAAWKKTENRVVRIPMKRKKSQGKNQIL